MRDSRERSRREQSESEEDKRKGKCRTRDRMGRKWRKERRKVRKLMEIGKRHGRKDGGETGKRRISMKESMEE